MNREHQLIAALIRHQDIPIARGPHNNEPWGHATIDRIESIHIERELSDTINVAAQCRLVIYRNGAQYAQGEVAATIHGTISFAGVARWNAEYVEPSSPSFTAVGMHLLVDEAEFDRVDDALGFGQV